MYTFKSTILGTLTLATITLFSSSSISSSQENTIKQQSIKSVDNDTTILDTQVVNKANSKLDQLIHEAKRGKELSKSIQKESEKDRSPIVIRSHSYIPVDKKDIKSNLDTGLVFINNLGKRDSILIDNSSTYNHLLLVDSSKHRSFWRNIKGWFYKSKK